MAAEGELAPLLLVGLIQGRDKSEAPAVVVVVAVMVTWITWSRCMRRMRALSRSSEAWVSRCCPSSLSFRSMHF